MKSRIFGIETEFGIEILDKNGKVIYRNDYEVKKIVKDQILSSMGFHAKNFGDSINFDFLINGARLYKDTGNHLEYSTPECRSVSDLIIHDKAGELVVLDKIAERKKNIKTVEEFIVYKNNVDTTRAVGAGCCWGCHENYLVPGDYVHTGKEFAHEREMFFRLLVPFLISRQIYSGAGWFFLRGVGVDKGDNGGPLYVLSQRAPYIRTIAPSDLFDNPETGHYSNKQMIKIKDISAGKNESNRDKFKRLEIGVGESNLADWSNYLKIGTTAIVLRMIEDRFLENNVPLEYYYVDNPITALLEISKDLTCRKKVVRLRTNQKMSSLDIQRTLYLEPAKIYLNRYGASEEEKDVLEKWEYVINALRDDPLKLSDRLDAWIRLKLFQDYMDKHRISWDDWRVGALNLVYGDIDRERSIFYRLQEKGKIKRLFADREIYFAKIHPPHNTRARLRGTMIELSEKNNWYCKVDWHKFERVSKKKEDVVGAIPYTIFKKTIFILEWRDPFLSQDERVDELIKKYEK